MLLRRTSWSAADDASITPLFSWSYSLPFLLRIRGDDARPASPSISVRRSNAAVRYRRPPPEDLPRPLRVGGGRGARRIRPSRSTHPDRIRRAPAVGWSRRTPTDGEDGPVCAARRASAGRACGYDGAPEPPRDPARPDGIRFGTTVTFFADGDYFPAMRFTGPSFGPSKFARRSQPSTR